MSPKRYPRRWLTIAALAGALSCSERPAAPTVVSSVSVSALNLSGLPADFAVGDEAQLRASATMSDGGTQDVTTQVRWSSTTLACIVTPTGMVTAVQTGECAIGASVSAVAGSLSVSIAPARFFTISGVVREKYQIREPPIAGAKATMTSGPQSGREIVADSGGRFVFDKVPRGVVVARIQAAGFESQSVEFSPQTGPSDILLSPEMSVITYDSRTRAVNSDFLVVPFRVTHRGPASLVNTNERNECDTGSYDQNGFSTLVRRAGAETGQYVEMNYSTVPCLAGTHTGRTILDPGNYELVVARDRSIVPRFNSAELTHPR